ncbi:putative Calcium-binding site [Cucumis melo var. makuwa]|uniref:Calcium-binding site n=1 Tax=Cucumis melo var. makuwa TaxID=1194695 RepID=A0A5A7T7S1_CUCMM|nr:putative Calcium-binding site [Cucumis melo var. makuwa]TYK22778.1 putative Calcium-binding site [Cucumis melo var. makuwa]
MKREGRQHGMVRTYRIIPSPWNPRPETRFVNELDFPPTAGLFTKVSSKPTNHSKFTGKCSKPRCSGCRLHPVQKAKDKTKGSRKFKFHQLLIDFSMDDFNECPSIIDDDGDDQSLEEIDVKLRVGDIHRHNDDDYQLQKVTDFESRVEGIHHHVDDEDERSYHKVEFVVDEAVEGDDSWCLVEERQAI